MQLSAKIVIASLMIGTAALSYAQQGQIIQRFGDYQNVEVMLKRKPPTFRPELMIIGPRKEGGTRMLLGGSGSSLETQLPVGQTVEARFGWSDHDGLFGHAIPDPNGWDSRVSSSDPSIIALVNTSGKVSTCKVLRPGKAFLYFVVWGRMKLVNEYADCYWSGAVPLTVK